MKIGLDPLTAGLGVAALGTLVYFGNKVSGWFGKSPEEKAAEEKAANFVNASDLWDVNFMAKLPKGTVFKAFQDKSYPEWAATQIYKSKGLLNDDEDALWNVIRKFSYKSQIPLVAGAFSKKYKKSVIEYLKTFLNAKELAEIADFIKKLPSGFPSNIKFNA